MTNKTIKDQLTKIRDAQHQLFLARDDLFALDFVHRPSNKVLKRLNDILVELECEKEYLWEQLS